MSHDPHRWRECWSDIWPVLLMVVVTLAVCWFTGMAMK